MKNSILIITSSIDTTIDLLISRHSFEFSIYRLNIDELEKYDISYTNYSFEIKSQEYTVSDIHSIYFRKIFLPSL